MNAFMHGLQSTMKRIIVSDACMIESESAENKKKETLATKIGSIAIELHTV